MTSIDKIRTDTQSIMDSSNKLKYTKEKFEIDKESITNIIKESLSSVEHNETYSHMIRIWLISSFIAKLLSEKFSLSENYIEYLWLTAPLHDFWKIWIPPSILEKPGKLTKEEYAIMQKHPLIGWHILEYIRNIIGKGPILEIAQEIALCHHEKYDWTWYPYWLNWEGIPLSARIVGIADVIDVLKSTRVYKPTAFSDEKVAEIIREWRWKHFDPFIADIVLENLKEILQLIKNYNNK